MPTLGNERIAVPPQPAADDITISDLLPVLRDHPASRLTFRYDGRIIRPGYHVTEVKAGLFSALDCGANPEAWAELFVQLLDVNESPQQMTAWKFAAIISKVTEHVALDTSARLTFEVSDGVRPMQLYRAAAPIIADSEVTLELLPRPASCKPRDRWLESRPAAICGTGQASAAKCC